MTSDGTNTYTWTFGNRMSGASGSFGTASYAYDADNRRTRKTVNGTTTRYLWSGSDELGDYNASGGLIRRFIPTGTGTMDDRLAVVDSAGTVAWFHTDHQGSVIAMSLNNGQTIGTANYSPYGEFGDGVSGPPAGSYFGYTGRLWDPETGLYQYRARYYHPRLGVFLSTDPVGTKDDPNLYLYVGLDPVNMTDPTGMELVSCRVVISEDGTARSACESHGGNPFVTAFITRIYGPDGYRGTQRSFYPGRLTADEAFARQTRDITRAQERAQETAERLRENPFQIFLWGGQGVAPSESEFWQSLRRHNATTRTNGLSGRQRRYYQYDRRHGGEVEVYDRNGRHLGAADPHTGEMIKGPVKGRRIRP